MEISNKTEIDKRVSEVLAYCQKHIDQMWAATVAGMLLNCDFRDADEMLKNFKPEVKTCGHSGAAIPWDLPTK